MNSNKSQQQSMVENTPQQKTNKSEQGVLNVRESITIFLMAVSFALLGISFRNDIFTLVEALALRIFALLLYWFSYLFFLRSGTNLSSVGNETQRKSKKIVFYRFLYFFGFAYAIIIVLLSILWR
ncbi:MAG: hypothetical protein IMW89_04315 [Ktedonobacteraceae bacterium]|nr:hypothetical protein [Ktedonobacteraceae bacterium]